MTGLAERAVPGPDVAQERVAESFAIAHSKAARFDPARGDGRRWLFGIGYADIARMQNASDD